MQIDIILTVTAKKTLQGIRKGFPIIVNEGGSSSGKSYGTVQLLIYLAFSQMLRVSIVSHSLPHLKRGCIRDFKLIMQHWNLWDENNWSATNFVYTFPHNQSYIEFIGLEDEQKARGPRRDVLFVNEANLIRKEVFDQLAMRTTGVKILDLNPADFQCWCYDIADKKENLKIHSTYKNNLKNLSQSQIEYIESYKDLPDDFMWKVYGLGERGAAKELIFTNWKIVSELPNKGEVFYGLDFGFTAPMAMTKVELYDGQIYVEEILYKSGMTITDLANYIKTLGIGRATVYCDTAEPKSIEELIRFGINAKKSDKDVWAGILAVKSFALSVTKNSVNLQKELSSYKWRKDSNDNVLEEPIKMHDHLIDSMRYAIHTHTTIAKKEFFML